MNSLRMETAFLQSIYGVSSIEVLLSSEATRYFLILSLCFTGRYVAVICCLGCSSADAPGWVPLADGMCCQWQGCNTMLGWAELCRVGNSCCCCSNQQPLSVDFPVTHTEPWLNPELFPL